MESRVAPTESAAPSPAASGAPGAAAELLARAEALLAEHRYEDVLAAVAGLALPVFSFPHVALRLLFCEGWANLYLGRLAEAEAVLTRARDVAELPSFGDVDRCEATFRLGACRLKRGQRANGIALLTVAVDLAERAGTDGDRVRASALEWRSRGYQLQRDWDAARADAHQSLELAEALGDSRLAAAAAMQCSLVAERCGEISLARYFAEQGRGLAVAAGDRQTEARLLNNLGALSCLLGDSTGAVRYLKDAFALALDVGNDADAAQAVSSLAQVHLRRNEPELAEEQARHALSILGDRDDYVDEIGNARIVLGRALLAQRRHADALRELRAAEWALERLGSTSHLAMAWVAQGDALRAAGDGESASDLYRRAAEALMDIHF
ncbi:MAG TPA: tetratricopeptide repeat protein [Gaiellaceae bacterium]|nr:tetratricopeptide repeat protein [Gaiellaceae bacterium]